MKHELHSLTSRQHVTQLYTVYVDICIWNLVFHLKSGAAIIIWCLFDPSFPTLNYYGKYLCKYLLVSV